MVLRDKKEHYLPRAKDEFPAKLHRFTSLTPYRHPGLECITNDHCNSTYKSMSYVRSLFRFEPWIVGAEGHAQSGIQLQGRIGVQLELCMEDI